MKPAASRLLHALAIAVFATMVLLAPATTSAQEARGTITGKVLDTNNSVLAGATVKVTNIAMGATLTLRTNEDGFYQAPYLIPGTYQVVVEATGFKRYVRDGILVRVNDNIQIDIELEIGALDQTVTVTADAPLLDTNSASMGAVVDSRRVAELPIPHGEPFKLIGLAGGVSYTNDPRLDRPFEPTHIVGYAVNGTRANRSDVTIDGVPSTSTANANEVIASFVPPQDLIQEFKVQTATFDASFGNTEGGVTNLSIKSGTNSFHGTAYYTKMPGPLMANDFFGNSTNTPLPEFNYTRWGGTVGGPVLIPKLYNGRNRTFFMYGIEGIPEARPRNNGIFNIPTAAMRNGDFTELLAVSSTYQIFNPFSTVAVTGGVQRQAFRCDASGAPLPLLPGTKLQDQTTGAVCNKIPAALFNPIARNFVDTFLPSPTSAGAADGSGNFQQPGLKEKIEYLSNTIRIDHALSEKHRIFGRGSWYNRDSNYNNYFGNLTTGEWFLFKSRQGALDHVWLVAPTVVINTRYGYNRFIRGTNSNPENRGLDLTTLGFPDYYNNLIPDDIRRIPRFSFVNDANNANPTNIYQGTAVGGELRPTDTHAIISTVNHSVGAHSLKYGVEFRAYRETDSFFQNDQSGEFRFDSQFVRGPSDTSPIPTNPFGFSFAAFLLGLPSTGVIQQRADYAEQSTTTGLFIQDDWKVNSRLTINLGLRYEVEGALTERFNRSVSGFDFTTAQAIQAQVQANYANNPRARTPEVPVDQFKVVGGLLFPNVDGAGRGLYETPRKNFMPRFGFAFKLDDKTVLRGGYGIFFGFLGQRRGDVNQIGFNTNTAMTVSLNRGVTFIETLSNPFQTNNQNALNQPRGSADGIRTFLGQNITFFNQNPLSPYNQRFELSVQRELPGGWVAELAYVGNRGTHIEINRNLNVTPQRFLSTSPTRDSARDTYLNNDLDNPFAGQMPSNAIAELRGTTIDRFRLLRPFPQFNDVNTTVNDGYSWYHSLQTNMNKRFSQGYTLGASYTYSKFMQATEFLNQDDPRPNEIISDADRPHRFSLSGIYELPFGKGRKFFADNKVASYFIGGWQISTVYQFQSGAPLTGWGNFIYNGDLGDIKLSGDEQSLGRWFNTTGFVAARTGTAAASIFRDANGQVVWLDFNDPCKNSYNPVTCPGTPLSNPQGFNRDASFQLASNVRTFPQRFSHLRSDQINNIDFSILKKTEILENKNIEFRAEFLNGFNHPLFPLGNGTTTGVITNPTNASFGRVVASTQANYQRRIQLTLKFTF
jgi:Carboxypeptidase regulatory-like domain